MVKSPIKQNFTLTVGERTVALDQSGVEVPGTKVNAAITMHAAWPATELTLPSAASNTTDLTSILGSHRATGQRMSNAHLPPLMDGAALRRLFQEEKARSKLR